MVSDTVDSAICTKLLNPGIIKYVPRHNQLRILLLLPPLLQVSLLLLLTSPLLFLLLPLVLLLRLQIGEQGNLASQRVERCLRSCRLCFHHCCRCPPFCFLAAREVPVASPPASVTAARWARGRGSISKAARPAGRINSMERHLPAAGIAYR